jgi:hypothetical protein
MNLDDIRQLIRIRHELRRLKPDRDGNTASRLIALMRALTARDCRESASVEPEIERWQVAFQLHPL